MSYPLAPLIYEGGWPKARGEFSRFSLKNGNPSDPAAPGHLKVNCPKGKRGHPGVPLRGEAWGSLAM